MSDKITDNNKDESIEEDKRQIVISRLSGLSPSMMVSMGSEGSFTPKQLIDSIKNGDEVGKKIVEIQLEWIKSFKNRVGV